MYIMENSSCDYKHPIDTKYGLVYFTQIVNPMSQYRTKAPRRKRVCAYVSYTGLYPQLLLSQQVRVLIYIQEESSINFPCKTLALNYNMQNINFKTITSTTKVNIASNERRPSFEHIK